LSSQIVGVLSWTREKEWSECWSWLHASISNMCTRKYGVMHFVRIVSSIMIHCRIHIILLLEKGVSLFCLFCNGAMWFTETLLKTYS